MHTGTQLEFTFREEHAGYSRWQEHRREAMRRLARKLGLPVGHRVEVILHDGIRLRGMLLPAEESLLLPEERDFSITLRIDRCTFTPADVAACVRTD